jgi:hypothetical protein
LPHERTIRDSPDDFVISRSIPATRRLDNC